MKKYLANIISRPGILIFEEKHGTRYFVCNNSQEFCRAAMKVLRERLEDDYWYHDEELEPEDFAKKEAAAYCGIVYRAPRLIKDKTRAQKISDTNDYEAALEFMEERSDYEYERMKLDAGEEY